ncbi:hypothetical protein QBZ16_003357 [Prototheca wickerhamii]|uniref:YbaK/aminoacyl-tRNA synthetase-associated domain-containing protein n=1 Tax=Prototheca wickerhamii TaxID=3111 RepID=A0AAD9ILP5_PROWI|nr:hypothetical protein QBZ16_003357 [Prototheca wickerhamii]
MEDLVAALASLDIDYDRYDHEPVMTCEKQVRDAVLSQRLGTGKGGLRMAPAIDVEDYLQVQPGSLTPLALAAPKAGAVAFLLDARIKSAERIFAHPGVNTVSLALTPAALESFLKSVGREVQYVDLTAEPTLGPDNRPDLSAFTQLAVPVPKREEEEAAAAPAAAPAAVKAKKPNAQPSKQSKAPSPKPLVLDTNALARQIVDEVSKSGSQAPPAGLEDSLKISLNALRNAAYAEGFAAARGALAASLAGVR